MKYCSPTFPRQPRSMRDAGMHVRVPRAEATLRASSRVASSAKALGSSQQHLLATAEHIKADMDVFEKSQTVDPEVRAYVYSLVSAVSMDIFGTIWQR